MEKVDQFVFCAMNETDISMQVQLKMQILLKNVHYKSELQSLIFIVV